MSTAPVFDRRRAGVLLHPTSLPSGTLGDDVGRFLDWLTAAGLSAWQMLPVGPAGPSGSPYSSSSAFAGHDMLLPAASRDAPVDRADLDRFLEREAAWIGDYALFMAIREREGGRPWWAWPAALKDREPRALRRFGMEHRELLAHHGAEQYRFARHWARLREAAAGRGVLLIGDLPMFVVADSADVWSHRHLFRLDDSGRPLVVAGVPPDLFSRTGQCWDNPVYDWAALAASGFDWWLRRLRMALSRFDIVRLDHFRGLEATWLIPVGRDGRPRAALDGAWVDVPGRALLERLREALGPLPLIAENLGVITPEVERLRHDFGLPGMHVLQFAFDGTPDNPHLPANHEALGVACTGTHDNDTTLGWWRKLDNGTQALVCRELAGTDMPGDGPPGATARMPMPDALVDAALQSRSRLAMIPLQDLMRLGDEARMNRPGVANGQWRWRFDWTSLTSGLASDWRSRVEAAERA